MKKGSAPSKCLVKWSLAKRLCSHALGQQRLFVLMSLLNSTSNVSMLTILLLVHPSHMDAKGIFTGECFLTMVAIVTKMPREVGAFNMIPQIGSISGLLPALGTLVVPLPILDHQLFHVLVKHSSCAKMSWEVKI